MGSGRLLLVSYHYIRDPAAYAYPGIYALAPEAFARQIEDLKAEFHIASPDEAEAFVLGSRDLQDPSVLITFDDGLVDHAETATDILEPLGVKALFFICSRPLTEQRALSVNKVHWLRATTPPSKFRSDLLAALPEDWRGRELSDEERVSARHVYKFDWPEDGELKYLINFILPAEVVDRATTVMLGHRGLSEASFCRSTYMDRDALRDLVAAGHTIGAHTHDHRPVTRPDAEEADRLLALHVAALEEATGRRPSWFSYPYGRDSALPSDPAGFCRRHGFAVGVTLTGTWVVPQHAPYALDRITASEVDQVLTDTRASTR